MRKLGWAKMREENDKGVRASLIPTEAFSEPTRKESASVINPYFVAVHRANQNDLSPDVIWTAQWLAEVRKRSGVKYARRVARAISFHLKSFNAPDVTESLAVDAVLFAPDDINFTLEKLATVSEQYRKRARRFEDNAHSIRVLKDYRRFGLRWEDHCERKGLKADALSPTEVIAYLETLVPLYAFATVRNNKSGISSWFRERGLHDQTREPAVNKFMEELERASTKTSQHEVTSEERYRILSGFSEFALDLRNKVLVTLVAFTRLGPLDAVFINGSNCKIEADGVVIASEDKKRYPYDIFVGAHVDPHLDLRISLRKLLDIVHDGPLFQSLDARSGAFNGVAIAPMTANRILQRSASRAGVAEDGINRALKRLFMRELLSEENHILVARQLGHQRISRKGSSSRSATNMDLRFAFPFKNTSKKFGV